MDSDSRNCKTSNSNYRQISRKGIKAKLAHLYETQLHSDVVVRLGSSKEAIFCHQIILAMNSPVFETMLSDRWASEPNNNHSRRRQRQNITEIELPDDPKIFQLALQFLYTEQLPISLEWTTTLEILKFANIYFIQDLVDKCVDLLTSYVRNAFTVTASSSEESNQACILPIFEHAIELAQTELETNLLDYIKRFANLIVNSLEFESISHSTLCQLLEFDDLNISELDLFHATLKWANTECFRQTLDPTPVNQRLVLNTAIHRIRFPVLSPDSFVTDVVSKEILTLEERVEILTYFSMTVENREKLKQMFYFQTQPRSYPSEFTLKRFEQIGANDFDFSKNWRFLCFQVDRPINITSLGFYGSSLAQIEDVDFEVRVSISCLDEVSGAERQIIHDSTKSIVVPGKTTIFDFTFEHPIKIPENVEYSIGYVIKGANTFMGDEIQDSMTIVCGKNGKVTFNFGLAKIKNNRYQIPEIRFTL